LVHPALSMVDHPKRVLVLGGGDGLATREILKYPSVEDVQLVDLDPGMTTLARDFPLMRAQNQGAFLSPKVHITNQDAYLWLKEGHGKFDAVVVDFPDPNNFALGKLYTSHFYRLLKRALKPGAPVVVQSTSPLMARRSFWCVAESLEAAGFYTRAYHVNVPSFGEWGYVLARDTPFPVPTKLAALPMRFLNAELLPTMFVFSEDTKRVKVEANRLDNQILVQYYDEEWKRWN